MSVAVTIPTAEDVRWECAYSMIEAARLHAFERFTFGVGGSIVENRNNMVRWFLNETDCDRLLMVDSDTSFVPTDISVLEADDLDIVTGLYFNSFDGKFLPVIKPLENMDVDADHPILEVAACGAGFLMLSRTVLEKMAATYSEPLPWFSTPVLAGEYTSEDFGFCHFARAAGFRIYADIRVQVNHYKIVRLAPPESFAPPRAGHNRADPPPMIDSP